MDLLLDTHVFIWWDMSDRQLGVDARKMISDSANRVFVSAASIWEIAVKQERGRFAFFGSPLQAVTKNGFLALAMSGIHAEAAAGLPLIHRDPFDRMLIAQALTRGLVLVTSDRQIQHYAVPRLWAR